MYKIKHIGSLNAEDLSAAAALLDKTPAQVVACNNWSGQFPYAPDVHFRMGHNNEYIFIKFEVRESCTLATITSDNGEVWTDSCCEFFIAFDESGYYNFEFSCIGKALLGFRKERPNVTHGTAEVMTSIKRFSTLGTENFNERTGDSRWALTVAIPVTAFFRHQIKELSGLKATANIYKCGDKLTHPHYLSWMPIDMPKPNFHVPQFFTEITFE